MAESEIGKSKEALKKEARDRASNYAERYGNCSQCTLFTLQELLGLEDELTFKAATCLGGGISLTGNTCGALLGGAMAIGMKYGRANIEAGFPEASKGMLPAYKLVKWFKDEFGSIDCRDIIVGLEMEDEEEMKEALANPASLKERLDPEQIAKCWQVVGKTAEKVVELISEEG